MCFTSAASNAGRIEQACERIIEQLQQRHPSREADMVLAFASPFHADALDVLDQRLNAALKPAVLLITTGEGVLATGEMIDEGPGLSVMAANLPGVWLEPFSWEAKHWPGVLDMGADWLAAGEKAGPARGALMFADRMTAPCSDLLPRLEAAQPAVPVAGGLLSSAAPIDGVRMLVNGRLQDDGAVGVVMRGEVDITCCVSQGARPVGQPWIVTETRHQQIFGLGGRNAVDVAQQQIEQLPAAQQRLIEQHGLFLGQVIDEYRPRFGRGDFQVRELLDIDHERGCLTVNDARLPAGHTVQFHVLDPTCIAADLGLVLESQRLLAPPAGMLLFSGMNRGRAGLSGVNQDPAAIRRVLGARPLAGFCPDGEIGPARQGNCVHAGAASLMLFRQPQPAAADTTPAKVNRFRGMETT
jgi:small ligand-binding sensory domain FIST